MLYGFSCTNIARPNSSCAPRKPAAFAFHTPCGLSIHARCLCTERMILSINQALMGMHVAAGRCTHPQLGKGLWCQQPMADSWCAPLWHPSPYPTGHSRCTQHLAAGALLPQIKPGAWHLEGLLEELPEQWTRNMARPKAKSLLATDFSQQVVMTSLMTQKTRLVKHCACQAGTVGQMHAPMGAWRRMSCAYGSIYFGSILSSRFLLSLCVFSSMTALGTGRPSAPFSAVVLSSLVNVTCTMGTCEMNAFRKRSLKKTNYYKSAPPKASPLEAVRASCVQFLPEATQTCTR